MTNRYTVARGIVFANVDGHRLPIANTHDVVLSAAIADALNAWDDNGRDHRDVEAALVTDLKIDGMLGYPFDN